MKRVKLLVCAVCMVALSISLCSCNYLDDLKDQRVEIEDGTVTYNGHTYTQIQMANRSLELQSETYVYVVDPEVPLLLTDWYGDYLGISWDGKLLSYLGNVYASDELTDEEIAEIENTELDHYVSRYDATTSEPILLSGDIAELLDTLLADSDAAIDYDTVYDELYADVDEDSDFEWSVSESEIIWLTDSNGYFVDEPLWFEEYENGSMYLFCNDDYVFYRLTDEQAEIAKAWILETASISET